MVISAAGAPPAPESERPAACWPAWMRAARSAGVSAGGVAAAVGAGSGALGEKPRSFAIWKTRSAGDLPRVRLASELIAMAVLRRPDGAHPPHRPYGPPGPLQAGRAAAGAAHPILEGADGAGDGVDGAENGHGFVLVEGWPRHPEAAGQPGYAALRLRVLPSPLAFASSDRCAA